MRVPKFSRDMDDSRVFSLYGGIKNRLFESLSDCELLINELRIGGGLGEFGEDKSAESWELIMMRFADEELRGLVSLLVIVGSDEWLILEFVFKI